MREKMAIRTEEGENMAIKRKVEKEFYIHQAVVLVSCSQHSDKQSNRLCAIVRIFPVPFRGNPFIV